FSFFFNYCLREVRRQSILPDRLSPARSAFELTVAHDDAAADDRADRRALHFSAMPAGNAAFRLQSLLIDRAFALHVDDRDVGIRPDHDCTLAGIKVPDLRRV